MIVYNAWIVIEVIDLETGIAEDVPNVTFKIVSEAENVDALLDEIDEAMAVGDWIMSGDREAILETTEKVRKEVEKW